MTPSQKRRTSTRTFVGVVAAVTGVASLGILAVIWLMGDEAVFKLDSRRDLLLDPGAVELLEGFGERRRLEVWHDAAGVNPDRRELGLMLGRPSRWIWHVGAQAGRFEATVARLQPRPPPLAGQVPIPPGHALDLPADDAPVVLRVTVVPSERGAARMAEALPVTAGRVLSLGGKPGEAEDGLADPVSVEVIIPPAPAVRAVVPEHWREGPAALFSLALPDGAQALEIEVISTNGGPLNAAITLNGAHTEQTPREASADDAMVFRDVDVRLLGRMSPCEDAGIRFGSRLAEEGAQPTEVRVCEVDAVVSFTGRIGRPALALAGARRAEFDVDIAEDTVFVGAVALDARLPAGSRAELLVTVDGDLVAIEDVTGNAWRKLALPLGEYAGEGRRLGLAIGTTELIPEWVLHREVDFAKEDHVDVAYRAEIVRLGVSNPRLERPASVRRRAVSARRPNVIVLHIETLRADVLPLYGGETAGLSPNLDRLGAEGVVWETAIAPSPWTLPSTATLLTGLPPQAHGVDDHDRMALPADIELLPERARAAGVATGGFLSNDLLRGEAGFSRGFSDFALLPGANARQLNDLAETFIRNHHGQQFLLVLHYWDPHHHFNAPGEHRFRFVPEELRDVDVFEGSAAIVQAFKDERPLAADHPALRAQHGRYLGDIAWLDGRIGELVELVQRLGLAEETVFVITSDHGEEWMEHGRWGHGSQLFDESVRVPLIVYAPGGQWGPPRRVTDVVGTGSVFATVLDLLDVTYDAERHLPALTLDDAPGWALTETAKGVARDGLDDPLRRRLQAVRTADRLAVRNEPVQSEERDVLWELYDLEHDPAALTPLPFEGPEAESLRQRLLTRMAWSVERKASSLAPGGDAELMRRLEELGYTQPDDEEEEADDERDGGSGDDGR